MTTPTTPRPRRPAGGDHILGPPPQPDAVPHWARDHPIRGRMVVVSATRPQPRRRAGTAIEMYRGGCVPMLCSRYAGLPEYRTRIRLLSAAHGVLHADALVTDDEMELTDQRIAELQPSVVDEFTYEFSIRG